MPSVAGNGEVHRDGLADPNGGCDLVDVMHAILVWEVEIPVAPESELSDTAIFESPLVDLFLGPGALCGLLNPKP